MNRLVLLLTVVLSLTAGWCADTSKTLEAQHAKVGEALDTAYFAAGHRVDIALCDLHEKQRQRQFVPVTVQEAATAADHDLRARWLALERRRAQLEKRIKSVPDGSQALTVETLDPSPTSDSGWFMVRSAELRWADGTKFPIPLARFRGGAGPAEYSIGCPPAQAVWVYGTNTDQRRMQAWFDLPKVPAGDAQLVLNGQDHDKPGSVRVRLVLNGKVLFQGPNNFAKLGWSERSFRVPFEAFATVQANSAADALMADLKTLADDVEAYRVAAAGIADKIETLVAPVTRGLVWSNPPRQRDWWRKGFVRGVYFDALYLKPLDPTTSDRAAEWGIKLARDAGFNFLSGYVNYYAGEPWGDRFLALNDRLGLPYVEAWWGGYPYTDPVKFQTGLSDIMRKQAAHPSFIGFGIDEPTVAPDTLATPAGLAEYRQSLAARAAEFAAAGITIPADAGPVSEIKTPNDRALWAEWQLYRGRKMGEFFRDQWSWATTNGIFMFPVIMGVMPGDPQRNSFSDMGRAVPLISTDIYQNAYITSGFFMQLLRSAANDKAYFVPGAGYACHSPARFQRDLAVSMVHADGVCMWTWCYFDKYRAPQYYWRTSTDDRGRSLRGNWEPEYWDITRDMYGRMARAERYLTAARPVSPVVLLFSERTPSLQTYQGAISQENYFGNNLGIYAALLRRAKPFDARLLERTTPAQLRRYKVALLTDARSLSAEEVAQVREWVKAGGTLIASGGTTLCDPWGRLQQDFSLSDVLGAHFTELKQGATQFRVAGPAGRPIAVTYPQESPYVKVRPAGAVCVAAWENGDPALLRHAFGQGQVYFLTACRPGLYNDGTAPRTGLPAETRPGFPQLVRWLTDQALAGVAEPLMVSGAPDGLEVQVRKVRGATVVHLLDWADDREVRGLQLTVNTPGQFEVVYAGDEQPQICRMHGPGTVSLRPVKGYDLVVVRRTG